MSTRSHLPSKNAILYHWRDHMRETREYPFAKLLPNFYQKEFCFACGIPVQTDRAHITPVSEGGTDDVENLHLLCKGCHAESEVFNDELYYEWFNLKDPIAYFRLWKKEHSFIDKNVVYAIQLLRLYNTNRRIREGLQRAQEKGVKMRYGGGFSEEALAKAAKTKGQLARAANKAVSELISSMKQEGLPYRMIAYKLNQAGYRTRSGGTFNSSITRKIYQRYVLGQGIKHWDD